MGSISAADSYHSHSLQYYGFGPYAFELLSGYDCPTYATYLNSTFHVDELSKTHRNSCVLSYWPCMRFCLDLP